MRRFDALSLYQYGSEVGAINVLAPNEPASSFRKVFKQVGSILANFAIWHKNQKEFEQTVMAADAFKEFISGTLLPLKDDLINSAHIELKDWYLREFEFALKQELGECPIFLMEDKRGYSAKAFINSQAEKVFSGSYVKLLPRLALDDINEAGKCLIHDQHTAAGFHMMRAVENVLRRYYKAVTSENPINSNDQPFTFVVLVNALSGKVPNLHKAGKDTGQLEGDILPTLKRLGKIYRNPIMHPEMILKEDDAIDVFDHAKSVITAILRDVRDGNHLVAWQSEFSSPH